MASLEFSPGMGLTFIAFEGYEIIAQSGEEIIRPARNVPRGIFYSVAIAVAIYVAVGIVAIGATTPPPGMATYQYLGVKHGARHRQRRPPDFSLGYRRRAAA